MPNFDCQTCKQKFYVSEKAMAKYPNWQPKFCLKCKKPSKSFAPAREENLTPNQVLAKYSNGPMNGVFTDGAAEPNPGPGGWGVVYVVNNIILAQDYGHDGHTTNNRMELRALIEACRIIPSGTQSIIYTDSELCVNTCTLWAKKWEARGWKKKKGEIKNLELVKELHGILKRRPEIKMQWIQAHSGNKWNEYADSLATAYRRTEIIEKFGEKFDLVLDRAAETNYCEHCFSNQWNSEEVEGWVRKTCKVCGNEVDIDMKEELKDIGSFDEKSDVERLPP
ncbi:MAG: RNase H family protein [Patescibacteria group bacterium]|jgi:ribonuclease HI